MLRRTFPILAPILCAVVLLSAAGASPADPNRPSRPADPNAADPNARARVYTNKDLAKYGWAKSRAVVVDTTPKAAEEVAPEDDSALYLDEKERRLDEVREKIGAAEARIAEIQTRLRSLANPFLPRPQVSEEEREAEAGMGAKERFTRLSSEKAALEKEIEALKAEQDRLLTAPTRPRSVAAPTNPGAPPQPQP